MKSKNQQKDWIGGFKEHVLETTYWGKVAFVAKLMLASSVMQRIVQEKKLKRRA